MTKIFFPYNDQPKQFSFKFSEPIRFPFYVNDLVYYWEVGSDGITMYLLNNKIDPDTPIVKDVLLEETGITMYLVNETADTSKHIFVEFAKIFFINIAFQRTPNLQSRDGRNATHIKNTLD